MTKEESIKSLFNTKVYVDGKSKEIQEKLISLGFHWQAKGKQVANTGKPFLFIKSDMRISYCDDMEYFTNSDEFREITANNILNIVIDEPKYRPFENGKECWKEMLKHYPFGWMTNDSGIYYVVNSVNETNIGISDVMNIKYTEALLGQKFADGTPFGIKEE